MAGDSAVADGAERPGERDIVDVVPGGMRQRAVLPPTGHAAIDQRRIFRERNIRSEPQALHHTGPVAFQQNVRLADQAAAYRQLRLVLEVQRDRAPPAPHHVGMTAAHGALAVDPDDIRPHVREHHGTEGCRTQSDKLNNFNAF